MNLRQLNSDCASSDDSSFKFVCRQIYSRSIVTVKDDNGTDHPYQFDIPLECICERIKLKPKTP